MRTLLVATFASAILSTSVMAGGISMTLPSLTFPPAQDTTVAKDCLPADAVAGRCVTDA